MTVADVDDVAVELGRPTPEPGSIEYRQWLQWLDDAEMQIELRLGSVDNLDPRVVAAVERMAVAEKVKQPDAVSSTSRQVSIDDGSVQTTSAYKRATGLVTILDEWWDMLDPRSDGGSFSIGPARCHGRAPGSEWSCW